MSTERPTAKLESPLPIFTPTALRSATELPRDSRNWISEVKWNGVRAMVYVDRETQEIKIMTKEKINVDAHFPELTVAFRHLAKRHSLVLDGEIIHQTGKTDDERKKVVARVNANYQKAAMVAPLIPCSFIAFDLLSLDGQDLRRTPLIARKRMLDKLLTPAFRHKFEVAPNHFEVRDHQTLAEEARKQRFEGIVLKRKNSHYSNRASWLKIKFKT